MIGRKIGAAGFMVLLLSGSVGCASFGVQLKKMMGGQPSTPSSHEPVKFSDAPNVNPEAAKNFERMTAEKMRDQSQLAAGSGSLWVMEGQGAYLFAQNTSRLVGDILNVRIDGHPKEQIQSKTQVIKTLMAQLEKDSRQPASQGAEGPQEAEPEPAPQAAAASPQESEGPVQLVTTRITDILKDGSYKIQGDSAFMIGMREYKLLVKGIVRAEDFNESGISAEKLLDPSFDIVNTRKN